MAETPIYNRLPTETTKAYEAFSVYRDMGPQRSHEKVSQVLGKSIALMNRWSRRYNWVERVAQADKDETKNRQEQAIKYRVKEHRQRIKEFAESYSQHGRNSMMAALLADNIQIAYLQDLNRNGIVRDKNNKIIGIVTDEEGKPVISKDDVSLANSIVRSAAPDSEYWAKALRIDEDFLSRLRQLDEGDDGEV